MYDYPTFADGELRKESALLAQGHGKGVAQQLGYLGSALTWSHMAGLVKSEHFSASAGTSMWPQLQIQGLGFTSWTGYNNRMLGYLGCVHCRECFFFKSRKKVCFPLKMSNHRKMGIWTCSVHRNLAQLWLLTTSFHNAAHF